MSNQLAASRSFSRIRSIIGTASSFSELSLPRCHDAQYRQMKPNCLGLDTKHALRVPVEQLLLVFIRNRRRVHEFDGLRRILIRIVDRPHDVVGAQDGHAELQHRVPVHSARRDHKILLKVIARPLLECGSVPTRYAPAEPVVDAVEPVRNGLAHVPQNNLQIGNVIEDPAGDQLKPVQPRLGLIAPNGMFQMVRPIGGGHRRHGRAG